MFLYKCGYKKYTITKRRSISMNFSISNSPVNAFAMMSQPSPSVGAETAGSVAFGGGAETAGSVASSSCGGSSGFSAVA